MNTSDQINELATALALAQAKMSNAIKNAENPAFKQAGRVSKYADLASVREASLGCLNENGIALLQTTEATEHGVLLITRLIHKSGQWIEGSYPLPLNPNVQQAASAMTYARRYGWSAICGLATELDDDGDAASRHNPDAGKAWGDAPISPAQVKVMQSAIVEVGADLPRFLKVLGVENLNDLPAAQYEGAMQKLMAKRAKEATNGAH